MFAFPHATPPPTAIVSPVTQDPAREHKYLQPKPPKVCTLEATAVRVKRRYNQPVGYFATHMHGAAISAVSPMRFVGTPCLPRSATSGSMMREFILVGTGPGAMQLTVMQRGPSSSDRCSTSEAWLPWPTCARTV